MHLPSLFSQRFAEAIAQCSFASQLESPQQFSDMIRPAANPKFGDYQANFAMPIGKLVQGLNPRQVAEQELQQIDLNDRCEAPEIAGPGFINLKLSQPFLEQTMQQMISDDRCLVQKTAAPKKILIDYSSPNVAKPMHVGHIRTTVIGYCLAQTLRFLGHDVVTDNHLGDWGTQFGIIIYGYKHFGDAETVAQDPVPELAKLYRIVHHLMGYQKAKASLETLAAEIETLKTQHQAAAAEAEVAEGKEAKKKRKSAEALRRKVQATEASLQSAQESIAATEADPVMSQRAEQHPDIGTAVLMETSKLHAGDAKNQELWEEFLPHCKDEINRVYARLNVDFDHTLGESFYHPMLAGLVDDLIQQGLATESDGAICVFLEQFDSPMIIRKRDGAFLYATTDLATLKYRQDTFQPDEVLYVVDARQGEHFQKLFVVADTLKLTDAKLVHVSFGTVLGEDGKPMKTRSGSLIGLESLIDDAVDAAYQVVCDPDRVANFDPPMESTEQKAIAEAVGVGAIKYADLSHDRTSDYKFSLNKMVQLTGNTAAYAQYSYARASSILRVVGVDEAEVQQRIESNGLTITEPAERALAIQLLRFEEALQNVYQDYAPNQLVDYVYSTAEAFAKFNNQCHVKNAPSQEIQDTRLGLVVLTGRVLKQALTLLGINVVPRM